MKIYALLLLLLAAPAHADSILEFSERDEACAVQSDPPLVVDQSINRENPLAAIDPAYNWPEYSDEGFDAE